MKLFVGLGNPGAKYNGTRHNVGFMFLDHLVSTLSASPFAEKWNALVAEGEFLDEKALFIKPSTFMNLSGQAVQKVAQFYKVPIEDIIVIYDDVDLPFESLRFRDKGSAGTHNGMKSIVEHLGTSHFPRLRIGVESRGRFAPEQMDLSSFVLAPFADEEIQLLDGIFKEGVKVLQKSLAS